MNKPALLVLVALFCCLSPRPALAADDPGQITVVSEPTGGEIRVDGKVVGKGSAAVSKVMPGQHFVEVGWPDGSRATQEVTVNPGRASLVRVAAPPKGAPAAGGASASSTTAVAPPPGGCPDGQAVSDDTRGHCCWPGQSWSSARSVCIGAPTSCPTGTRLVGEACQELDEIVTAPITVQTAAEYVAKQLPHVAPAKSKELLDRHFRPEPIADRAIRTTVIASPEDKRVVILASNTKWRTVATTLHLQPTGRAKLPSAALRNVVQFAPADRGAAQSWMRAVAQALVDTGSASAAVVTPSGAVEKLSFAYDAEHPGIISLQRATLAAGTDAATFGPVVKATGPVTFVAPASILQEALDQF